MCSAHPPKKDLPKFEGLTAEQEDYFQHCARAQVGAILHDRPRNHELFSKELMEHVEPDFVPSPPTTPELRRRKQAKQRAQPARRTKANASPSRPQAAELSEEEEESPSSRRQTLADMAAFWDQEEDG